MTVNHPQWGTMCEICFEQVTVETAAEDEEGKWDIHSGDCAKQAGIKELACTNEKSASTEL